MNAIMTRQSHDISQKYSDLIQIKSQTTNKRKYDKLNDQMRKYAFQKFGNTYGKRDVREVKNQGALVMKMQLKISELQRNQHI